VIVWGKEGDGIVGESVEVASTWRVDECCLEVVRRMFPLREDVELGAGGVG
jgi:hypothetical protein